MPCFWNCFRIRTLSVAFKAASGRCPRRPQAAATAATAAEKSVAAVNTASSPPFCCSCFAYSTSRAVSFKSIQTNSSASAAHAADGFPSAATTVQPSAWAARIATPCINPAPSINIRFLCPSIPAVCIPFLSAFECLFID